MYPLIPTVSDSTADAMARARSSSLDHTVRPSDEFISVAADSDSAETDTERNELAGEILDPEPPASDPSAMIGYCDQAQGSNRSFLAQYRAVDGNNAHFDIPAGGQHDWSSWGPQLAAMSGDLAATLR
jgi:S-formylglutathione hydrolase FrmB